MREAANDDLMVIQCSKCPAKFQAADAVSMNERESKLEIVEKLIPHLGWRRSGDGWECPVHA